MSRRASTSPFLTAWPTLALSSISRPVVSKARSAVAAGTTEPVVLTLATMDPRLTATCWGAGVATGWGLRKRS